MKYSFVLIEQQPRVRKYDFRKADFPIAAERDGSEQFRGEDW